MNLGLGSRRKLKGRQASVTSLPTVQSEGCSPPPADDDSSWESFDLSSTEYATRRRELMQLINDLRSMGANTMIDLPSIVVIGGQSAGKSSLVEAVSGVNVPRDSGTCTRCPMELTMSSSATTWSCTIKLRFDYDSSGQTAVHQQREITFGSTIFDKDTLDIWLRRAQAAILNPDLSPDSFYGKSIQELKNFTLPSSLKFSRNVVSVFINDPSAMDLSFVDLPGLIQNEDQEIVDLVRELTESYIRQPNAIILTTIPMSDDMQNQQSVKLARDADPEGGRTIGILTKPDTLGDGAIHSKRLWVDVIEGRQHKLTHGYYCVRLPDDAQRAEGISKAAAQHMAADFFDTTQPWSDVTARGHFGVPAFVTDVSVLLVKHISKVIPQLKQDVEQLLVACLEDIDALPGPLTTDPQVEVLRRVNSFCDAFKGMVSGADSDKTLAQRNRKHYTRFAQDIRGTAPDFRPFEQPMQYLPIYGLESTEEACVTLSDSRVRTMGVRDVNQTILNATSWELPGNIPYEAKTRLINQFTTLWSTPAEKCLADINDALDDIIQELVKTHFGRFKFLYDLVLDLIHPDIEEYKNRARNAVQETLALEKTPIYTQNVKDYQDLRVKWLAKYRNTRRNAGPHRIPNEPVPASEAIDVVSTVWDTPSSRPSKKVKSIAQPSPFGESWSSMCPPSATTISPEEEALQCLARAGYHGLAADDLARLSRDKFTDELTVMADVRAYFTIACKRIIDHVPLKIEHSLHQALAERLRVGLLERLIVDTSSTGNFTDRMKELVREDPATEVRRVQLEAKRTRLREMKKRLANFVA